MLHRNKKVNVLVGVVVVLMLIIGFIVFNSAKADVGDTGTIKLNVEIGNGEGTGYNTINYVDDITLKIINTDTNEERTITINRADWQNVSGNNYTYEVQNVPNGNYKIEYVSHSSYYMEKIKLYVNFQQDTFSVNGEVTDVDAEIRVVQSHKMYVYYKDWSGRNPETVTKWWGYNSELKFDYKKDAEGNNVYTYNKDGQYSEVKSVDGERTIIEDIPYGNSAGSYSILSNLNYGGVCARAAGIPSSDNSSSRLNYYVASKDSFSFPESNDQIFYYEYIEKYGVYNINKTTKGGDIANANFYVTDNENQHKIVKYDHYDSYEFEGTTYENVYILNGELSDEVSDDGLISTINGKATIIYPMTVFVDDNPYGFYFRSGSFSIFEKNGIDSTLCVPNIQVGNVSGYTYRPCSQGAAILSSSDPYSEYSRIYGENFTNSYVQGSSSVSSTTISNYSRPSVKKIVKDSEGNIDESCTDKFTFGLYDDAFNLISTVEVTGNETKYFDVQMSDSSQANYYNPTSTEKTYYIAELKRNDYILNDIHADETTGGEEYQISNEVAEEKGICGKAYKFVSDTTTAFVGVFENTPVTTEISGKKTWIDNDDEIGARPESITVNLLADGSIIKSIDVNVDRNGEWKYTFSGLKKYNDDEEIVYTVSEDHVDSYKTVVDGFDITNTIQLREITVKKVWDDNDNQNGTRPDGCQVQLYADNEAVGDIVILNSGNNWEYTWSDLITERDGNEIIYTIKEINTAEGYTATVVEDGTNGFVITNKYSEQKEEAKEDAKEEIKEEVKEAKVEESKSIKTADFVEFYVTMFILSLFVVCLTIKSNKNIRK